MALVYLLRERGLSADDLDRALNEESGLKALAGADGDVRALESAAAEGDEAARLALAVYAHRVAAAIGAMTASLGGPDALVFTAGVGERFAGARVAICKRLAFLGVELDPASNAGGPVDADIATAGSAARVLVVRAREELVIARAVRRLVESRPA